MEHQTSTALTLPQRAAVALGSSEHEAKLRDLVKSSADIVEVKNVDGREQAHRIGMILKNARIAIEKAGKAAREDATAFSKAIIAEQDRLVAIVDPEETRIFGLRDAFDAAEEAKRQAAIKAERERVENIQAAITAMRSEVANCTGKPSEWLKARYETVFAERATEDFYQEFFAEAKAVRSEMLGKLSDLIVSTAAAELSEAQAKAEREAESARLKAEREELERFRAEAAEAQRQADESRRRAEADIAVQRAELAQQQAAIDAAKRAQSQEIVAIAPAIPAEQTNVLSAIVRTAKVIETSSMVNLGAIQTALGFMVSSEFLAKLGYVAHQQKTARLYFASDYPGICEAIAKHVLNAAKTPLQIAA